MEKNPLQNQSARADALHAVQTMVARGDGLEDVLVAICLVIERHLPHVMSSIMVFDASTRMLHLKAAPSLPEPYRIGARQMAVGPESGICGTAAYTRQPERCADIFEDPRCLSFRDLAKCANLRACAAYPILAGDDRLIGTFAFYYSNSELPGEVHDQFIAKVIAFTAVAIERYADRRALHESEQRYRSLFTRNPDGVYSLDSRGRMTSANSTAIKLTGLSEAALLGLHYSELLVPESRAEADAAFQKALEGQPQRYEVQIVGTKSDRLTLDITNLPIVVDGVVEGVYGIAKDVTQRKTQETELRLLRRSVASATNGIVIADALAPDFPLIYANDKFLAMTGYGREDVLGRASLFLCGPETDPAVLALLLSRLAERLDVRATLLNYRKDGTTFWNDMFISPVPSESGEITHFIGIQQDVTEHRAREALLDYQARYEPVTGLPNRTLLEKRLVEACARARRDGLLLALLYVDLDDFKPVNDTLGYGAGDLVLKRVAERLNGMLSASDTLARLGGDEFVVVLPEMPSEARLVDVVENILRALDRPYQVDGHDIHITASIGIAIYNDESISEPVELIQHADMAMYRAKQRGRNTYYWYTPEMTATMNERVVLRRELREAIRTEAFQLHYQPLISASTGRVEGFEALIRWQHPERGLISPAAFIPLAEQTGQIIPIGEWVLDRACRDIVALNRSRGTQYSVAVNISPLQFHVSGFFDRLRTTLAETEMPARWLAIELTESVLVENVEMAIATLHELRRAGVDVSIDDFGTGFSSLSYLKRLPISKIKIDRSFTREIWANATDAAIAQGIIAMAHHLGLQVVAEGIEFENQQAFLAHCECDIFQGYLFGRPMSLEALGGYLDDKECA